MFLEPVQGKDRFRDVIEGAARTHVDRLRESQCVRCTGYPSFTLSSFDFVIAAVQVVRRRSLGKDQRELDIPTVLGAINSTSRGHSNRAHKIAMERWKQHPPQHLPEDVNADEAKLFKDQWPKISGNTAGCSTTEYTPRCGALQQFLEQVAHGAVIVSRRNIIARLQVFWQPCTAKTHKNTVHNIASQCARPIFVFGDRHISMLRSSLKINGDNSASCSVIKDMSTTKTMAV